jgi:hypothetical protein
MGVSIYLQLGEKFKALRVTRDSVSQSETEFWSAGVPMAGL